MVYASMFLKMQVLAIKLVEQILEELSRDEAIVVSISGPLKDSATVALPTFLGLKK